MRATQRPRLPPRTRPRPPRLLSQANAVSEREKRSTISPADVVRALEELEFGEQYVEAVKAGAPPGLSLL